jgi:four helix bundle protein
MNESSRKTGFDAYDNAVEIARAMRAIVERIRRHDRSLADQTRRATQSIGLNVAEARRRTGGDRQHSFRIALGSAGEVRAAVEQADAWGYVEAENARQALELLDRECAMLVS